MSAHHAPPLMKQRPDTSTERRECSAPAHGDGRLERQIDAAYDLLITVATSEAKRCALNMMCTLIGQRSRQWIAQMERERGLNR